MNEKFKYRYNSELTSLENKFLQALCKISDDIDFISAAVIFLNTEIAMEKAIDLINKNDNVTHEQILDIGVEYGEDN